MNKNIPSEVTQKILESFNKAGSANINTLQQVRDVQVVMGSLLQHETKRLEKKLGKKNLRVQQVQASIKRNQTITRDLEVELEIAKIRVPEVDPKDSLIHGRIVDENRRGWRGLAVYLADVRGNIVHALGKAQTDVSGYYALPIPAETLKQLAKFIKEGVLVVVCNSKGELIYRHKDPVMLVGGDRQLVEIVLKRSDLTPSPCETTSVPVQIISLDGPNRLSVKQPGTFVAKVNEDATPPLTYSWDFGDKTKASTLKATHSYTKPGNYIVTFAVSNQNSNARQSITVTVRKTEAATVSTDVWVARGRVMDKQDRALGRLVVSLFDYDQIFDDRLGNTQTDENGEFILTYRTEDFRDLLEAQPDLYLKILDQEGNILYSSESAVRCEASREEVFEIRIEETRAIVLRSTFRTLKCHTRKNVSQNTQLSKS